MINGFAPIVPDEKARVLRYEAVRQAGSPMLPSLYRGGAFVALIRRMVASSWIFKLSCCKRLALGGNGP